jgi:hypothetical protein
MTLSDKILIFPKTVLSKQGYIFMYSVITEMNNMDKTKTVDCENVIAFWNLVNNEKPPNICFIPYFLIFHYSE